MKGKAILVSGHDLKDLHGILEATKDKGINVYTHGEMLPAHSYPKLKAYPQLVGNYGGAWQDQQKEFAEFPGADRDDLQLPDRAAAAIPRAHVHRGAGRLDRVRHIENSDFSPVVQAAQALPGFAEEAPEETSPSALAATRFWASPTR